MSVNVANEHPRETDKHAEAACDSNTPPANAMGLVMVRILLGCRM
jgi:hypothetical protein